jgi:predicted Zn-dependent peptidase
MSRIPWHHQTLPGGLLLASSVSPAPDLVAARLWIAGGSSTDPAGQRGAHQLLAGLLTRGCGDLDAEALADLVEGCGAALRCEASEDHLGLHLKCATGDATRLIPLLLQMVLEPRLEQEQIAIERQLNLQTLQRQREDPFHLCHEALRQQLYGNGPYGHDPLGVETDLVAVNRDDLARLQAGLGRRGAALVIAGTLPAELPGELALAADRHGWTPASPGLDLPLPHPEPDADALELVDDDTGQVVLMLGCRIPPLSHPDSLPLRLLQAHLGLGMSSRLFIALREERGLAYDVGVHMPARRGPTPFIWHLSTSADRAEAACTALLDEWEALLQSPITDAALKLAVAKYRGQEAMGRQTCGQQADRHALLLSFGLGLDYIETCLERAGQIGADALLNVARRRLIQPRLSLCGPRRGLQAAQRAWENHPIRRG